MLLVWKKPRKFHCTYVEASVLAFQVINPLKMTAKITTVLMMIFIKLMLLAKPPENSEGQHTKNNHDGDGDGQMPLTLT